MEILAVILAIFLAMNIGANNSAAEMGAAYGAGVRSKKEALALIAIFATLGAVTAGGNVIRTLSKGLVPEAIFKGNLELVFIVILVTTVFIFIANLSRVPIATTHAIVCSVVGVGAFYHRLAVEKFITIIGWWIITPCLAFGLSYFFGKVLYFRILHLLTNLKYEDKIKRLLGILITISGCYVAYSAGSNNAANSVGPIVGAGVINIWQGAILAGLGMSSGALLLGGRVLETVGKKITDIGIVRAILVEATCATIILIASLAGIPVSLGETVTSGIIGLGCAKSGFAATFRNEHVMRIWLFWISGPFFAFGLTFLLLSLGHWFLPQVFSGGKGF